MIKLLALLNLLTSQLSYAIKETSILTNRLEFVTFVLNGKEYHINRDKMITVVSGDTLVIKDAHLTSGKPEKVNFVGFVPANPKLSAEDRGYVIKTDRDLLPKWAVDGKNLYRVEASSQGEKLGGVRVQIIAPELKYVEIKVNGTLRVLQSGESTGVHISDDFSVEHVVTNIENDGESVHFKVIQDKNEDYRIIFNRGGRRFASVNLKVSK